MEHFKYLYLFYLYHHQRKISSRESYEKSIYLYNSEEINQQSKRILEIKKRINLFLKLFDQIEKKFCN